jgi:hypothetical protein
MLLHVIFQKSSGACGAKLSFDKECQGVARNGSMIPHRVKAELAATREGTDCLNPAIRAVADLADYARTQRLTMADELLTELLAFLFVAQLSSSNEERMASKDCALQDVRMLGQPVNDR